MEFLLSHWHCILPVIGIGVAMFFMRDKNKDMNDEHNAIYKDNVIPQEERN